MGVALLCGRFRFRRFTGLLLRKLSVWRGHLAGRADLNLDSTRLTAYILLALLVLEMDCRFDAESIEGVA